MRQLAVKIPDNLDELVNLRVHLERIDKPTAFRRLAYEGGREFIIGLYKKGEISLSKGAELLGLSVYEILELSKNRG